MTDLHNAHEGARELNAHKLQKRAALQSHAMALEAARCWTPSEVAVELFGDGKQMFAGAPVLSVDIALRVVKMSYCVALQHFRATLEVYPDRPRWVLDHLAAQALQSLALQQCMLTLDVDPRGVSMAAWVHGNRAEFEDQLFDPAEVRRWLDVNCDAAASTKGIEVSTQTIATVAERKESQDQRRERRYMACINDGLPMPKDDYGRLPNGIGRLAASEGISTAAFAKDLKRFLATKTSTAVNQSSTG